MYFCAKNPSAQVKNGKLSSYKLCHSMMLISSDQTMRHLGLVDLILPFPNAMNLVTPSPRRPINSLAVGLERHWGSKKYILLVVSCCVQVGEELASVAMTKMQPQPMELEPLKKLQRLPPVFSRVLELPFPRDTNVRKHFTTNADHFFVPHGVGGEPDVVKVHIVRLERWDITRVVVHIGPGEPDLRNDLVYDKWRFPLAETSILSMVMAGYVNGQLIVVVPRMDVSGDDGNDGIPMWPNIDKRGGGGGGGEFGLLGGASHISAE